VTFRSGNDADRRCADETVPLDVVSNLLEHMVARGSERGRVRDLAAGDEGE
jgi:hypothetical protein